MKMLGSGVVALVGLLAAGEPPAEAMSLSHAVPAQTQGANAELQLAQYGYGYRGPYGYHRPYGYGRPFGYRRFGYDGRRPYGYGYGRRFGGRYGFRRRHFYDY